MDENGVVTYHVSVCASELLIIISAWAALVQRPSRLRFYWGKRVGAEDLEHAEYARDTSSRRRLSFNQPLLTASEP